MTAPLQVMLDGEVGLIDPVVSTQITLTSELFKKLPTDLRADKVLPAAIVDENTGVFELVRIIAANGTSTVAVQRGCEGTDAQNWNQPVTIRCAARAVDMVTTYLDASKVPPGLPVGSRYTTDAEKVLRTVTRQQGNLPNLHMAPADLYRGLHSLAAMPTEREVRAVAFPVGPIYTNPGGYISIFWDGQGNTAQSWTWNLNLENRMALVSAIVASGYGASSDAAWVGNCIVAITGGSSCAVQCFDRYGNVFANRLVKLSVVAFGV